MNVRRHLNIGQDGAIKYPELAERMGVSEREAQDAVQHARLQGEPIVSGNPGLWIATSDAEALAWCERQRSRAIHLMESAQGVQRGVEARRATVEQTSWLDAA